MKIAVVIPQGFTHRSTLRFAAHKLSKNYTNPEVLIRGESPVEQLFTHYLQKYNVAIVPVPDPAPPIIPTSVWGKIKAMFFPPKPIPWDPVEEADEILLFSECHSSPDIKKRLRATGKRVWVVNPL